MDFHRWFETNRMHRADPCEFVQEFPATEERTGISLAVIEFDDQGDYWDSRQVFAALGEIERKNVAHEAGVITYIFVHGWKNNASKVNEESGIFYRFEVMIEAAAVRAVASKEIYGETPPHVCAVFIAWRGLSLNLPVLKDATFWSRKLAAGRVAGSMLTIVLAELLYKTKENPNSKSVVIGHSFGGLIVEQAMTQIIISWLTMSRERVFQVPWDLLLLLNPASPAITAYRLVDYLHFIQAKTALQDDAGNLREIEGPLLASLTSKVDRATMLYFPFGQFFSCLLTSFRKYTQPKLPKQQRFVLHTAGHLKYLHSHAVRHDGGGIHVEPIAGRANHSPYWIMQVPSSISAGHSDIFGENLIPLFRYFADQNEVFNPNEKIVILKKPYDDPGE